MPTTNGEVNINLTGIEAQKVFLTPVYTDPAITSLFRVMPNINYKRKMAYLGEMPAPIRKYLGCDFNPTTGAIMSERDIETELVEIHLQLCDADYQQSDYDQLLNYDSNRYDFNGTALLSLTQDRLVTATQKQLEALAFFGDKTSADPTINLTDGMFTKYLPEGVAKQLIPYTQVNQAAPLVLGDGIDLMQKVYYNRTKELRGMPKQDQYFLVSSPVYDRLEQDALAGLVNSNIYYDKLQDGTPILKFNGIQVIEMALWDAFYEQYLGVEDAKLVILTTKNNMVMATDKAADVNRVAVQVEPFNQTTRIRSCFKIGFNYVFENLFSVAY